MVQIIRSIGVTPVAAFSPPFHDMYLVDSISLVLGWAAYSPFSLSLWRKQGYIKSTFRQTITYTKNDELFSVVGETTTMTMCDNFKE